MTDTERSAAARRMGSVKSARKTEAARANLERARAAKEDSAVLLPCNCGRTDGSHGYQCPETRRAYRAKERARKSAQKDGQET